MSEHRKFLIALLLAALTVGSWWLTRKVTPPILATDTRERHDPDYIIESFAATVMNESGTRQYQLRARRLMHYPDDQTSHLLEPELTQYAQGRVLLVARGDTGMIPQDGRTINMRGDVRIKRAGSGNTPGGEIRVDESRFELDK
jgi:lipopolysaccharide export system protein LptC